MAISTNPKPTLSCTLYVNTGPGVQNKIDLYKLSKFIPISYYVLCNWEGTRVFVYLYSGILQI